MSTEKERTGVNTPHCMKREYLFARQIVYTYRQDRTWTSCAAVHQSEGTGVNVYTQTSA